MLPRQRILLHCHKLLPGEKPSMQENYDRNFGFLIHDVARLMRTAYDRRMKPLGLTRSQWWVLNHLYFNEGVSQSDFAGILDIERASVGRLLDRLEEKGWIARTPDPDDRRINRVFLTDTVRPIMQTLREEAHATLLQALSPLAKNEQAAMFDMLERMKLSLIELNASDLDGKNELDEAAE